MSNWLITGVAGFVGSHLLETLLNQNQNVVGLDNLSSGNIDNLETVRKLVGETKWKLFTFVQGNINDPLTCQTVTKEIDYVLHQAALVSISESFSNIELCVESNIKGFINVIEASKKASVKKVVYASSCAVEQLKSPYAISKSTNEMYANIQTEIECTGLRYFNIYGPRQDMLGDYSAVIAKWIKNMLTNQPIIIYGTGETTRDFIHVEDIVRANIYAATNKTNKIINVGSGISTSLDHLFNLIKQETNSSSTLTYEDFRQGDILHSCSTIPFIKCVELREGIDELIKWYKNETKNTSNRTTQ
jgi:UDP-N-acetylglucosamine 4-epimerase